MKLFLLTCFIVCTSHLCLAQKPKNGTYIYEVSYAEWEGRSLGATCTVIVKGDSIAVFLNDRLTKKYKNEDIIGQGIIMQHKATGKWSIGQNPSDKYAKDIGGCSDGPQVIDFKHRRFESC